VGYPNREAERAILSQHRAGEPVETLESVLTPAQILAVQLFVRQVRVDPAIADYILNVVEATRNHSELVLGASTRAALSLYRAAQAFAVTAGRDYVIPDDVKVLAEPVLAHRLMTSGWVQGGRPDAGPFLRELLAKQKVPT
jgi:MoxR-like ATPase